MVEGNDASSGGENLRDTLSFLNKLASEVRRESRGRQTLQICVTPYQCRDCKNSGTLRCPLMDDGFGGWD